MKWFVSSRMRELSVERKEAIEAIHFAGHTPIYIETEPQVKDEETKIVMDDLLKGSDGFVLICYLSEGRHEEVLGHLTPIQYELCKFRELHPDSPVLLFRKVPDPYVTPSPGLILWVEAVSRDLRINIVDFQGSQELDSELLKALRTYKKDRSTSDIAEKLIIRYTGPDFIGLIAKISGILFSVYKLNIDYISHASRGGLATLYASCTPRELPDHPTMIEKEELRENLIKGIKEDLLEAAGQDRFVDGADPHGALNIEVDKDTTAPKPFEFYVELRNIDAPGQLNAVCRVLKAHKINIDELQLKPTPPEYKRQVSICLWLSKPEWQSRLADELQKEIVKELRDLEIGLRDLIGVRAFSIRAYREPYDNQP